MWSRFSFSFFPFSFKCLMLIDGCGHSNLLPLCLWPRPQGATELWTPRYAIPIKLLSRCAYKVSPFFSLSLCNPLEMFLIVYAGRLSKEKRILELIEVFNHHYPHFFHQQIHNNMCRLPRSSKIAFLWWQETALSATSSQTCMDSRFLCWSSSFILPLTLYFFTQIEQDLL